MTSPDEFLCQPIDAPVEPGEIAVVDDDLIRRSEVARLARVRAGAAAILTPQHDA